MIWSSGRNPRCLSFFPSGESVICSHFEYFTERQTKAEHFSRVIEAIKKALEFDKVEAQWLDAALKKPPATDKTTTASAQIVFA